MWEQSLPVFEKAEEVPLPTRRHKRVGAIRVLLVQSICCAVLLLLFWLFRVCGGSAYAQLKGAFTDAMHNNTLFATVVQLFDGDAEDAPNG